MNIKEARDRGYIQDGYYLDNGYYHSGNIILCPYCNGKITHNIIDTIDVGVGSGIPCEYDYVCKDCDKILGNYCCGHYKYYFVTYSKEELGDELCQYCSNTDYGENSNYSSPNGYFSCEGYWCDNAYEEFLENESSQDYSDIDMFDLFDEFIEIDEVVKR